ncbi:hypothetical protein, partial [Burkholderia pseudomultivorans]|uniref:hypothetical protein n=1 Tax=Burkholderia pseudomultivorans TaxID=1207504 RepID=UPI001E53D3B1
MTRVVQPDADRLAEPAHTTCHHCNSLSHPIIYRQKKSSIRNRGIVDAAAPRCDALPPVPLPDGTGLRTGTSRLWFAACGARKTARIRGAGMRRARMRGIARSCSVALDRERDAHPAADAQRRQPALRIALD